MQNKKTKTKHRIKTLEEWQKFLCQFARERDWEQFHTPKNLAAALSVEASELLEIFQWLSDKQSKNLCKKSSSNKKVRRKIAHEMADVLVYLLRLSTVMDIDLMQAISEKMVENAKKYPAEKVRGSAKKYNEY